MKMISYITNGVNFLATILQKTIILASYVGHVIVLIITTIISAIVKALNSVFLFLQIVYEDNITIFTEELSNAANTFYEAIITQCTNLQNLVFDIGYEVITLYTTITYSCSRFFEIIYIVLCNLILNFKKVFVFFGETCWFMLTFVPIHLPYLIKTLLINIKDIIVEYIVVFYMSLLNVTNFLSDVPLQSFLGIISAIILARLCITFSDTVYSFINELYWACKRKLMVLYYHIYECFINDEERVLAQIAGDHTISSREIFDDDDDIADGTNLLCVICQERQKCIVILPCRHVCLCSICFMNLFEYQRTCPICRTFINRSMPIYL